MSKPSEFYKGISQMGIEDLQARIGEDEQRLQKLKFAHSVTPLENPVTIRLLRKDIARLKTALQIRKIALKTVVS
jgi:large subunit ribosomal protein L29